MMGNLLGLTLASPDQSYSMSDRFFGRSKWPPLFDNFRIIFGNLVARDNLTMASIIFNNKPHIILN
jgi:hypothetical protein